MNFYFRTNASPNLGIGHVMRTSRVAKKLKKFGHNCFFYLDNYSKSIDVLKNFKVHYLYKNRSFFKNQVLDAKLFLKNIENEKGIVVVDDYRLDNTWEKIIYQENHKVVIFDDLNNRKHFANVYINYKPDFYIKSNFNKKNILKKNCKILLGPKYNIIECKYKKNTKKSRFLKVVFYTGGGSNLKTIYNILRYFLASKENILKNIKVIVILGPMSSDKQFIFQLVKQYKNVEVINNHYNIDKIIANADLIIGSAGNLVYEASFYKIPSLFFQISKNQINDFLSMEKLGHYFILPKKNMEQKRDISILILSMIKNYSKLSKILKNTEIRIDNKGLDRVVESILNKKLIKNNVCFANKKNSYKNLEIRKVNFTDVNHYLFTRNLKKNRIVSISNKKISTLDHYKWWLNTKRESYLLTKKGEKLMYFYDETINFNGLNYSTQGWFAISDNCSLQNILYALNWQKKFIAKKKDIKKSLGIISKKNKINFSKYLGWNPVGKNSYLGNILKQHYKVNKNYLFYSR